jgi:hypothetical protein
MTDEEFVQMCAKGPDTSPIPDLISASSVPKVCLIDDDDN